MKPCSKCETVLTECGLMPDRQGQPCWYCTKCKEESQMTPVELGFFWFAYNSAVMDVATCMYRAADAAFTEDLRRKVEFRFYRRP